MINKTTPVKHFFNLQTVFMKTPLFTSFLLLFFCIPSIMAQDLIERTKLDLPYNGFSAKGNHMNDLVQAAATNNLVPTESALFSLTTNAGISASSDLLAEEDVLFLALNKDLLNAIRTKGTDFLRLKVPVAAGKFIELELIKSIVKSPDYLAESSSGAAFTSSNGAVFYRGVVKGEPNSLAAISIFENSMRGLIMDDDGNYELGKVKNGEDYALFNDHKLTTPPFFDCHVEDTPIEEGIINTIDDQLNSQNLTTPGAIDIYVETDFDMYGKFGSSKSAVETFVMGLFNELATIYQNEQITIKLIKTVVWETTDPYASSATNASSILQSFEANRPQFEGILAMLFSTRAQAGGIAGLDRICSSTAHGLTLLNEITYQPYPTYSNWTNVTAHELGHLFGSNHTHYCTWGPNNNQKIDDCVASEGGTCSLVESPIPDAQKGTIMSYCHTVSGGGFNLNKGFGTEPGNLIRSKYNNAPCRLNCDHLASPLTTIAAASCTTTTSPTGLGGGFGGLISVVIGDNAVSSSLTVNDQQTFGGNGYLDFTTDCYKSFALDEGATYSVTVQTWLNDHNVKGWIDYNNNNVFDDPSEQIFNLQTANRDANNYTSGTASFTVSANAMTGTSLRMRFLCDLANVTGPCYNPTHGQCEDYPVVIAGSSSCPTDKEITDNPVSGTHAASANITTATPGPVEVTGIASFIAGTSITLNPGFHAKAGSTFSASISANACNMAPFNDQSEEVSYRNQLDDLNLGQEKIKAVSDLTIMPNPFNSQTNFVFNLEQETIVDIQIYDLNGQLIERLAQNQLMNQGVNNITYNAQNLSAGMYYVFLKAGNEVQSKKMVVLD